MDFSQAVKGLENGANIDLNVLKEPRGVNRVLQFIISILAALFLYSYEGKISIQYCVDRTLELTYSYPFRISTLAKNATCNGTIHKIELFEDDGFSIYAEYFLYISIASVLFCVVLMFIYVKMTSAYETDNRYPLGDFIGTMVLAVFWLFCSAAWSHGLSFLKVTTSPKVLLRTLKNIDSGDVFKFSSVKTASYFGLNVSALLGCLSFFLWAADLWFLYKETPWFQGGRSEAVGSPA
ncbi:synaptophysin [Nilaparvata lugens]|uniref:synaptophysin n=1 Tax=Nilaparvata lugens TaxID=108931 RepID=UPI000B98C5DC|nr:synaptophysin [Nilaparvata lugens]